MIIPISQPEENITRKLCELRTQKIKEENGYRGSYRESYKEVWDNLMTEKEKRGYSFNYIYEYMVNS